MKITIRQLNGCLAAMQIAKMHPDTQKEIVELIQRMIRGKADCVELPEGDLTEAIVGMADLQAQLVRAQRRR